MFKKIGTVLVVLTSLAGCSQSAGDSEKVQKIYTWLAEDVNETMDLLVSQCALVLQKKNLEKGKLLQANYVEKKAITGKKYYVKVSPKGKRLNEYSFFPHTIDKCSFSQPNTRILSEQIYRNLDSILAKNGFVRLDADGGLLKNIPQYQIGDTKTLLYQVDARIMFRKP